MLNFEELNTEIAAVKETQKAVYEAKLKCATEICTLMNELVDKLHSIGITIDMDEEPTDYRIKEYQVEPNGYDDIVLRPKIILESEM
jgi:DNA mismatch repair ATPase MutL